MKKLILVSIASLLLSSTYANAEKFLLKLPTRACTSNGGKWENGIYKAKWQNGKDICQASGARLPTIDELRMLIISCGEVVDGYSHNKSYIHHKCSYEFRGFLVNGSYWSSTESTEDNKYKGDSSGAWAVHASRRELWSPKSHDYFVLCVRGE